jgi:transcriptional regulator with XRE-family HTH domain
VDIDLVEFGQRLRRLRRAQGLTQEQLAEAANLNPRTVQKIEAGQIDILLTTLMRLQSALGCHPGELFEEDGAMVAHETPHRPQGVHRSSRNSADSADSATA